MIGGLKVLKEEGINAFYLKIWKPKATHPFANYYFKTAEKREEYIKKQVEYFLQRQEAKEKAKQDRKVTPEKMATINIGDIFYDSWGYEQTNVDFYQVVQKKNATVVLREIAAREVGEIGYMSANVVAVKDHFIGEEFQKRVTAYADRLTAGHFNKWDGRPLYNSWYA